MGRIESLQALRAIAFLGIFLAYKGYGIWALVGQQLFNITIIKGDFCLLYYEIKIKN